MWDHRNILKKKQARKYVFKEFATLPMFIDLNYSPIKKLSRPQPYDLYNQ